MPIATLDLVLLVLYVASTVAFGLWMGRGQRSAQDYLLGGRDLPWGVLLLSIVATETSTVTFLSLPGVAYFGDLRFLPLPLGYSVGRAIAATTATRKPAAVRSVHNPDAPNALVLDPGQDGVRAPVVVDPVLARELRPHQREGVRWMYRVLHGLEPDAGAHTGCLLADDMGLGKSLQSIALVWTMLKQGPRGVPTAKRVLVVCTLKTNSLQ